MEDRSAHKGEISNPMSCVSALSLVALFLPLPYFAFSSCQAPTLNMHSLPMNHRRVYFLPPHQELKDNRVSL